MAAKPNISIDQAARAAGYFLLDEEAEDAARDLRSTYRDNHEKACNEIWLTVKNATGGIVLSAEELELFMEGDSLRNILSLRLELSGEIRRPNTIQKADEDSDSRQMAFCLSCNRMSPVTYGYTNRVTGAVALDVGGPVDLIRTMNTTEEATYCAVCGHRVFTDEEAKQLEDQEERDKANWTAIWIFVGVVVVIILGLLANLPAQ